jgi:thiamine-phosphate pyrophosphorylase
MSASPRIFDPRLYLVIGEADCAGRPLGQVVRAAVEGGVTLVQLREKTLSQADFIQRARELKALLIPAGVPLIINDDLEVALASGADGLHLGQDDMAPAKARANLGPGAIIGVSVGTLKELAATNLAGCDYVGCGPVYATATKDDAGAAIGPQGLALVAREVRETAGLPSVAIGGISLERLPELKGSGAAGVALVSAIAGAPDPGEAARALRRAVAEARLGR